MKLLKTVLGVCTTALLLISAGCGAQGKSSNLSTGMDQIETADYDGALISFAAAREAGENAELVCRGEGLAYLGKTEYEAAVASFLDALTYCDGTVTSLEFDINYYLATAYYKSGDYQAAYETYCAILALDDKEADAYYLRGLTDLAMNNHDQAVSDFDRAIALDQNNYSMYINIYLTMDHYGYTEEGIGYLENAMSSGSKSMSDYDKGLICYYMGDYENACSYLDNANKTNGSEKVVLALGQAYEATGDINFAASIYTNYISNYGASASIYNQLGLCKLQIGDYEAAREAFENGIAMNDMDTMQTLKYNEIVSYEYLGDFKKACVLMETYLATYPDDEAAVREYEFLKTR